LLWAELDTEAKSLSEGLQVRLHRRAGNACEKLSHRSLREVHRKMNHHENLVRVHLKNLGKPSNEQDLSIYSDQLAVVFPFAPAGHTESLEGRAAFSRFLEAIGEFTQGHEVAEVRFEATDTGFILEYAESSIFRSTGASYASPILWKAEVSEGVITRLA